MKVLNEKLSFLLDKYSVAQKTELVNRDLAVIGGKEIKLNAYKSERRFLELKNMCQNGTLTGISVMRVAHIVEKGSDIYASLRRELDICQYVLGRKIKSIMVMQNDNVLNAIATTEDGVVCTLEISATLNKGETLKDKHEIIAEHGIACDIVVDAQLAQSSIYLFADNNEKFTDVDFELYGLSIEDIAVVRSAFELAKCDCFDDVLAYNENLNKLVELAKASATLGERKVL